MGEVKILVKSCVILFWMLVLIFYWERLLGMMEFYYCGFVFMEWEDDVFILVEGVVI